MYTKDYTHYNKCAINMDQVLHSKHVESLQMYTKHCTYYYKYAISMD